MAIEVADDLDAMLRTAFAKRPGGVAIRDGDTVLTYRELAAVADDIGRQLRALVPGGEAVVAVEIERSWRLVAAVVSVLASGFAFAIVDPTLPEARRVRMRAGSRPAATIRWSPGGAVRIDGEHVPAPSPAPSFERRLAYVAFTSGTSGIPKAAGIERHSLATLVGWHVRTYGASAPWRAAQIAGAMFDAFIWDVFGTIGGAGELLIVHEHELDPFTLWRKLAEVDVAYVPTPLVHMLFAEADMQPAQTRLRDLLTGGERLLGRLPQPRPWRLVDHYGPAECTVLVTSTVELGDAADIEPGIVGVLTDGARITIVDESLAPVPDGTVGEILVSGTQVARGYLGDSAMGDTAFVRGLAFVPDGELAYRTGDLGRLVGPRRALEFHGRIDDVYKIHGYPVALAEIEAALSAHPSVRDAVAAVRESEFGEYIVAVASVGATSALCADELRAYLVERVEPHMVPSRLLVTDVFPRTLNGKVDRRRVLELLT